MTTPAGPSDEAGAGAMAAPLAPPDASLTLTAPEPPAQVAETQAPRMAPQVAAAAVPELDAKVDSFMNALAGTEANSPDFAAQAESVRTMGDADIRKAAETSNRMLEQPVRALRDGGLAQGSAVGKTLLELRRTVEDLDPSQAQGARRWLDMLPFGDKLTDYFRKYQSAQAQLNGILHSLRNGQDELTKDNVSLNLEKTNLWATMGRLNQYVYVAERLDAKLSAPRDRHHHQEQHRAHQGRRPGVDHDHLGTAYGGHRRPGAGQPEAGARPDQRAQLHDVRDDPAHLRDAARELRTDPGAGGVLQHRDGAAAGRVRQHLRHDGLHRRVQAQGTRLDVGHHRRAGDRGRQVTCLPRPGAGP
jgi:hypothetical protein